MPIPSAAQTNSVQNEKGINDPFTSLAAKRPKIVEPGESSTSSLSFSNDQQKKHFGEQITSMQMELTEMQNLYEKVKQEKDLLKVKLTHQKLLTENYAMRAKIMEMETQQKMTFLYEQIVQMQNEQRNSEGTVLKIGQQQQQLLNEQTKLLEKINKLENYQQTNLEQQNSKINGKFAEMDKHRGEQLKQQNEINNADKFLQQQKDYQSLIEGLMEFEKMQQKMQFDQLSSSHWGLSAKVDEIEKNVRELKEQFGKINQDQKELKVIQPPNWWNVRACHKNLAISGQKYLTVTYKSEAGGNKWFSVFATFFLPNNNFGVFYYEITLVNLKNRAAIGFATKKMPLDCFVGSFVGSFSYAGDGYFWANASYKELTPFSQGDVVGCGVNLANRQIILTKNGQLLDTTKKFSTFIDSLFPCISLHDADDLVEANFGPDFEFDLSSV